jgi:hypothetical protein
VVERHPLIRKTGFRGEPQAVGDLSANEVRSYHTEKFTRTDDLGVLPELREMTLVARHQVVCTSSVSTFNEDVVGGVRGDLSQARRRDNTSMVLDKLKQLLT